MSTSVVPPSPDGARPTRPVLSRRQAATVDALLDAGLAALHEVGWDGLSLRDVARRAGVTHTTAYNYFTSKEHLVAEINWRLLEALPEPAPRPGDPLAQRVADALRGPSELFSADNDLADAVLASMVARDPDIKRLRDAIGEELLRRLALAVGPDPDPQLLSAALMLYSGAMVQAGMGYFTFDDVVGQIADLLARWEARGLG